MKKLCLMICSLLVLTGCNAPTKPEKVAHFRNGSQEQVEVAEIDGRLYLACRGYGGHVIYTPYMGCASCGTTTGTLNSKHVH